MKFKIRLLSIILIIALCMAGCRPSPVLMQTVYQQNEEIDEEEQNLDQDDEGEEDEDFENEHADVDTQVDTDDDRGIEDDDGDSDADATDVQYNDNNNIDNTASDEADNTDNDNDNTVTPTPTPTVTPTKTPTPTPTSTPEPTEEPTPDPTEEPTPAPTEEPTPAPTAEPTPAPTAEPTSAPGGNEESNPRPYTDKNGNAMQLPEFCDKVAAVGAAAEMVEMFGGYLRLAAADAEFAQSAYNHFADKNSIYQGWSGDGSDVMDEASFANLLTLGIDAVFIIDGQTTFSDAQLSTLLSTPTGQDSSVMISVIPLYPMTSLANIEADARIIGQVLDYYWDPSDPDNGYLGEGSASLRAENYCSWAESLISDVSSQTGGSDKSTLYIAGWDYEAIFSGNLPSEVNDALRSSGLDGIPYCYTQSAVQLFSTFAGYANVVNESTRLKTIASNYVYVHPLFSFMNITVTKENLAGDYTGGGRYANQYEPFVTRDYGAEYNGSGGYYLGSSQYNTIYVNSEETKANLENSWFWQYHSYDGTGFIHFENGNLAYHIVEGSYEIIVNPSGMESWVDGSAESPLESIFVACKSQGIYDIGTVKEKVNELYSGFFGYSLSGSELSAMLGE